MFPVLSSDTISPFYCLVVLLICFWSAWKAGAIPQHLPRPHRLVWRAGGLFRLVNIYTNGKCQSSIRKGTQAGKFQKQTSEGVWVWRELASCPLIPPHSLSSSVGKALHKNGKFSCPPGTSELERQTRRLLNPEVSATVLCCQAGV